MNLRRATWLLVMLGAACGGSSDQNPNWLTGPSYDTHARFFPLVGTVHASVACATCHTGASFMEFDCVSCHTQPNTDPIHVAVSGYQWTSAGCYQCHANGGGVAPANHDARFPISTGAAHATVTCAQCHTNLSNPTNPATLACASCHAVLAGFGGAHASVTGVSATTPSEQCLACHGDSQVNPVGAHSRFPVARGSATHDTVCLQCHTSVRADKGFAADFNAFACTGCHAQAPTAAQHPGLSGYVYASASCYQCHPNGNSVAPPANHDVASFPIAAGSAHAGLACSQCHTDLANPTNPASFSCASCHATLTGFSTAHARVAGMGASTTSAQCLTCHGDGQVNPVASHTPFTVVKGSGTHDTVCLQCHTSKRADKPFAADFTAFACVACHAQTATAALHPGVSGYAYANASCFQCHPSGAGVAPPANHDTADFPISAGTAHAGLACSQCHTNLSAPTTPANFACASCHATLSGFSTAHAGVAGVGTATTSAQCLTCHGDAQVSRVAAHTPFVIVKGSSTHDTACLQCHTAKRADKTFAADFKAYACTVCHAQAATASAHPGVTGYVYANASCFQCHPSGTASAPANHPSFFPIAAGSAHASVACSACHTDLGNPTNLASFACASCHATQSGFSTAHAQVAGVSTATASAQCLACHADAQVSRVAAHTPFVITRGSGTHDTVCLQCHTTMRTDKPFGANFKAYACTACHAQTATASEHTGVSGYVYASASCYGCHPGGAGAGAPANHDTADFPISAGTAHAGISCSQCHTNLSAPKVAANFACGTCHLSRDAALVTKHTTNTSNTRIRLATSEISTTDSATCLRCHADAQVTLTSSHPSGREGYPPHENARCLQCHDVYRTDKAFGLDFASDPALASKLAAKQGCYHCHNSAPPRD